MAKYEQDPDSFAILGADLNLKDIPLRMIKTEHAGRTLVATRSISPGQELFEEPALLRGPPQTKNLRCANCSDLIDLAKSLTNVDCPLCGLVLCKHDCQTVSGRDDHVEDCKILSKCQIKTSTARLAAKWLTVFRVLKKIKDDPGIWKKLMQLEDHLDVRKNCDLMELNVIEVYDTLKNLLPSDFNVDKGRVLKICGLLDGNAFRCDSSGDRGVYPFASLLNHDCAPNARVYFDAEKKLHLVAKRAISEGDEVNITYCSPLLSTLERQEKLLENKFFQCSCRRCRDPSESQTFMSALFCPKCKDLVMPHWSDAQESYEFLCRKCPFRTTQEKAAKLTEAIKAGQQRLLGMKMPKLSKLEALLEKQCTVLPGSHSFIMHFRDEISNYYAKHRSLETIERRISWLQDKVTALHKADGEDSRLMGFLRWNLHNLYIEKVAFCQRTGNMNAINLDDVKLKLQMTLKEAIRLLIHDGGCPKELKEVYSLQLESK